MADLIRECIFNFGQPPRRFPIIERLTYLHIHKPVWMRLSSDEKLLTLFEELQTLYRDGIVVWGHVVQANVLMFEDGRFNCPGELVYSLADTERATPETLSQVAHSLYSLKGTQPSNPALAPIADYLTDELIRVFGLPVPPVISPDARCHISTTFFVRKHLPNRRLCCPLMPIIVNPNEPQVALPLPERYWPRTLVDWWTQA